MTWINADAFENEQELVTVSAELSMQEDCDVKEIMQILYGV